MDEQKPKQDGERPVNTGNVTIRRGDLFESEAQTLVNAVNTAGVMGKGIAREFKMRFPDMYREYKERCAAGEVKLGEPYLFTGDPPSHRWILNFPTKGHWRERSRLSVIRDGLAYLRDHHLAWGITSLAVPALGCGAGGLAWDEAQPYLVEDLAALRIPVELYAPWEPVAGRERARPGGAITE